MKGFGVFLLSVFLLASCAEKRPVDRMNDEQLKSYAQELAQKFIITDGHIDLPYRLKDKNFMANSENLDTLVHISNGNIDFIRARKGGLDAPFMSIYIPSKYQQQPDYGKALADSLIDMVYAIAKGLPNEFALANTPADVEANSKTNKISLPMGMENGGPIGNNLSNIKYFYDRGIRYITLTHSRNNQICDSSGDTAKWNGLSPFGREVVKEMNRVGIMVDISHVDDSTFYQVMKLTNVPCIASHSSCRYFAPTVRRDMTDDMIKKLGENGGVMCINFFTAFIDSALVNAQSKRKREIEIILSEKKLKESDSLSRKIISEYVKEHPLPSVDIERVVDHIDHVVKVAGIDHVGFGSDFDGVDDMLPTGITDVSMYPNLIYALLKRGYTEDDIEKICYKNVWRVWNKVAEAASANK